jgi:hypothetical protein
MRLFFTRCVKFRNLPLAYQAVLNPGYVRRPSGEENPASGGGIRFGVNFRLMRWSRRRLHRRFRSLLLAIRAGDGNLAFTIRAE